MGDTKKTIRFIRFIGTFSPSTKKRKKTEPKRIGTYHPPPRPMDFAMHRARRPTTAQQTADSVAAAQEQTRTETTMQRTPSPARRSPRLVAASPTVEPAVPRVHKAVRQTGLLELIGAEAERLSEEQNKRKRPQARTKEDAWKYVTLDEKEGKLTATCIFCRCSYRVGSMTRIVDHLLGRAGLRQCAAESDECLTALEKLKEQESVKQDRKERKQKLATVAARGSIPAASASLATPAFREKNQTQLVMQRSNAEDATNNVARFFFGNNIPVQVVESETFKALVRSIRTAPLDWKPPTRKTLAGPCLQNLARALRREEAPLRQAVLQFCGTVLSDGWDTVDRLHLINQLVGNSQGIFFDGTVELQADDHEDAKFVAGVFASLVDRTGPLSIIQVCSDTCSTMKAAWKIIEAKYPWITATPCGTHVLNLELKDLAKIKEVKETITKVKSVLNLFWGRSRWPRLKLKQTISSNHNGASWGLYRAKATRFAGNIREMSRLLRAKNDLQEVVVSAEFARRQAELDARGRIRPQQLEQEQVQDDLVDNDDGGPKDCQSVKQILLDENGFWTTLVHILKISIPIVTLLRLMDSNRPCLGMIYDRMCAIIERMEEHQDEIPWVSEALSAHRARWEYLHSPMHAAAYALDPHFFHVAADIDSACKEGLFKAMERMMIRDVILKHECDISTEDKLAAVTKKYSSEHSEVVSRVAQCHREYSLYKRHAPPFNSQAAVFNASVMEPHEWWNMYGEHVPLLQSVAQRVLAQVASAFAAERNWSVYGQIRGVRSTRLKHDRADARVYCHEAIRLHDKLYRALDAAQDEELLSDSDSNASDDYDSEAELLKLMR